MSRFRGLERRITEVRCPAKRTPTRVFVCVSSRRKGMDGHARTETLHVTPWKEFLASL